jgi:hypothetical protein
MAFGGNRRTCGGLISIAALSWRRCIASLIVIHSPSRKRAAEAEGRTAALLKSMRHPSDDNPICRMAMRSSEMACHRTCSV